MKFLFAILSLILCFSGWISFPESAVAAESPSWRVLGNKLPLPGYIVSWLDDKRVYRAGDTAIINIRPLDPSSNNGSLSLDRYAFRFSVTVNGKRGNSSIISGVLPFTEGDPSIWNITFAPIQVGEFDAIVSEDYSGIADSTLHFRVVPGDMYPSTSVASWMNFVNEFVAGTKAYLLVLPKDAFGNNISSGADPPNRDYFTVSSQLDNGSISTLQNVQYKGWNEQGLVSFEFTPTTAGTLFLFVYGSNQTVRGSPLPFMVKPGPFSIANSTAKWKHGTNSLQVFSKLEIFVYQQDQFGNLVPGFFPFDAQVIEKATNLSLPVADLSFQQVARGVQLLSFIVSEPGDFLLTIFSDELNESIANVPYYYTVFIGYCDGQKSVVNGSGLDFAAAGRMSNFTVYLEDSFQNPSPIEAERLQIQILRKNDSLGMHPVIFPLSSSEPGPVAGNSYFKREAGGDGPEISSVNEEQAKSTQASVFSVAYTAEKIGDYQIWVFCGNIPLNDGVPYLITVQPGLVDTSLSSVVKFSSKVKRLVKNEIVVQLMDSFSNPNPSDRGSLSFTIGPTNSSSFLTWPFVDNGDGSYIGCYMARDLGVYNISVLFSNKVLSPCPIEVHVYEREYFSEARNDNISVWEDESIAFDVLSNDYVAAGQAVIVESSMPLHGSLLQYGQLFRYTPYKGFYGNDSFSYTIVDMNKNVAMGLAIISILCKPPHFVSLPVRLHITEDVLSPKFGGFAGFEIEHSDVEENISVTVRAQSGTLYLAPMPLQLWQSRRNRVSVSKGGRSGTDLILTGNVESINFALQWVQYLGNENFYGHDVINLYARNKNGLQDARVIVFVEPINDPPVIFAPKFIIMREKESSGALQIFNKHNDAFNFSVSDVDLSSFPGNKSHFMVTFSMEVNKGMLTTTLPVSLLRTAELKLKKSCRWEPLLTFVTISNHFVLNGKGVRFQGTIEDCNHAMQNMFYQGPKDDTVLTITINDMGNFGCYPDCTEETSLPLSTEVTVNLIWRRPISSKTTMLLGSAIILEITLMLFLGGILLFYMCKCMNALHKDKHQANNIEFPKHEPIDSPTIMQDGWRT